MGIDDQYKEDWIKYFNEMGVAINPDQLNPMGWKDTLDIWVEDVYHNIAQAMKIRHLKIDNNGELFFHTSQVPPVLSGRDWSIKLLKQCVQPFKSKYGTIYEITTLTY